MGSLSVRFRLLDQPTLGERGDIAVPHHQVVQHPYIDEAERLLQAPRKGLVCMTELGNATGMIVHQDHGCGVMAQGLFDYLPRVDRGTIDSALKQLFETKHPVPGIQVKAAKRLVPAISQQRPQIIPGI
ncbi:MAG: hypothetical protein AMJ68_08350, partial [Acidithiobacillales bacterium SG8_45]